MNPQINTFPRVIKQNEKKKGDFGVVSLSQQGVVLRKVEQTLLYVVTWVVSFFALGHRKHVNWTRKAISH